MYVEIVYIAIFYLRTLVSGAKNRIKRKILLVLIFIRILDIPKNPSPAPPTLQYRILLRRAFRVFHTFGGLHIPHSGDIDGCLHLKMLDVALRFLIRQKNSVIYKLHMLNLK